MQQVEQFLGGERDYTLIKGTTGPLVYPAAHVYIYSGLYRLTDGGKDIRKAQIIFAGLYLGVLSLVMACYRKAKVLFNLMPHKVILDQVSCWTALIMLCVRHHSTYSLF